MLHIHRIDHVTLRALNMDAMLRFYAEVLGLREIDRTADGGVVQLGNGEMYLDLVDVNGAVGRKSGGPPVATAQNMDHFCLDVQPFDEAAVREHLAAHGIADGQWVRRGHSQSVYIHDPQGNQIELKGQL